MEERLPPPRTSRGVSLAAAIARRRSGRDWGTGPISAAQLSQLLWAAQGVTGRDGARAVPSAGAIHPLVVHVLDARGVHRYVPSSHSLERVAAGDRRRLLADACLAQEFVASAPVVIVLASMGRRGRETYGARAERYATLEAGHAAQNVLLQATALGLAAVPVGAFYDDEVHRHAELGERVDALYVIPVGPAPG